MPMSHTLKAAVFGLITGTVFIAASYNIANAEEPRRGGILSFAIGGETPNYDCHANYSFAAIQWLSPHYSTLLKIDPANYPAVALGVAESYEVSPDKLTYSFKLRKNVKFHNGQPMTSADLKATFERIKNPPKDVISLRAAQFEDVASIETPDDYTIIFKLSKPDAAMLTNLASPWNCIYSAEKLKADPNFPRNNILGTGPFVFVEQVKGSHWVGKRFDDYFEKGKPYLDGFRAVFMSGAPMINAMQAGQISAEFRGFSPAEKQRLVDALGDKVKVQESSWLCKLDLLFNTEKKPFDNANVRRAISMAIDRWDGAKNLQRVAFVKEVGGILRPGYEYAAKKDELIKYPGFGLDIKKSRAEAKRLLQEAGVPNLKFKLLNRTLAMPYTPSGLFVIDQLRQIGVAVEHQQLETSPYQASLQSGNYDVALSPVCDYIDEPNLQLINYISHDKSSLNYGRYIDRTLDDLYEKQKRSVDSTSRLQIVRQFEEHLFQESYTAPLIWWQRIIVHSSKLHGWHVTPTHYVGQNLADVWLSE